MDILDDYPRNSSVPSRSLKVVKTEKTNNRCRHCTHGLLLSVIQWTPAWRLDQDSVQVQCYTGHRVSDPTMLMHGTHHSFLTNYLKVKCCCEPWGLVSPELNYYYIHVYYHKISSIFYIRGR